MKKSKEGFIVNWEAEDGYAGGRRPQSFTITEDDLYMCETEDQLARLFDDMLQEEFSNQVRPATSDFENFIEWGKSILEDQRIAELDREQVKWGCNSMVE